MSGKLFGIDAVNSNPLTNEFCIKEHNSNTPNKICKKCYSVYMLESFRTNCVPNFENNNIALSSIIHTDFSYLKFRNNIVRFNGHGELINQTHLHNLCNMTLYFPEHTFALWTKRIDIVRKYFKDNEIPKNLILIYSNPKTDKILMNIPKPFHKVFNNVPEDYKDILIARGKNAMNVDYVILLIKKM